MAARMAMMAMTTSNSISVNATCLRENRMLMVGSSFTGAGEVAYSVEHSAGPQSVRQAPHCFDGHEQEPLRMNAKGPSTQLRLPYVAEVTFGSGVKRMRSPYWYTRICRPAGETVYQS
jgi:hypothetical protein